MRTELLRNRERTVRTVLAVLSLHVALAFLTVPAQAQPALPRATPGSPLSPVAVDHFKEAVALYGRGEFTAACRRFEQSYIEDAAPGTLYNMALCHEREGRIADAYREYDDLASRAEDSGHADKATGVRARANALLPKLARVEIVHRTDAISGITGLSVDGAPLLAELWKKPLYLAPGAHVIGIQHADGVTVTRRTDLLAAGSILQIEAEDPAPRPVTQPTPQTSSSPAIGETTRVNSSKRLAAYVAGGSGLALVAAGAVLGALAITKRSDFQQLCPNGQCRSTDDVGTATGERGTARTEAAVSTVGFAAGGAALAAAVYLFVSSREAVPASSAWRIAPASDGRGAGLQLGGGF